MSDKRKKRKFDAKREQRRLKRLEEDGRLVNGVEIPLGAVPADPIQQVPTNSYSPPPLFYVDKEFVCVDQGKSQVWSAQQQKWYYEVAKGSLYATAIRCRECRQKRSAT
ncbi:MAG: zinc-ribbon domain containing protein [Pirellulaceae bacterium]